MSPLTSSYFFYWVTFDAAVGIHQETLGTCLIALLKHLGSDPGVRAARRDHAEFAHGALPAPASGGRVRVAARVGDWHRLELSGARRLSGKARRSLVGSWLPPPSAEFRDSIVITTPYVIVHPPAPGWYAFLERTLPKLACSTPYEAYQRLMKYGLNLNYWNEYIFEAYAGAETSAVFLHGLPDIALSRPHSRQTQARLNSTHRAESRDEADKGQPGRFG